VANQFYDLPLDNVAEGLKFGSELKREYLENLVCSKVVALSDEVGRNCDVQKWHKMY